MPMLLRWHVAALSTVILTQIQSRALAGVVTAAVDCPVGWLYSSHDSDCFYVTTKAYTATECNLWACSAESPFLNASLASITSQSLQDFLFAKLISTTLLVPNNAGVWIGLYKDPQSLKYSWSSATNGSSSYLNWKLGEPNNYCGQESCAAMDPADGQWLDEDCRLKTNQCLCQGSSTLKSDYLAAVPAISYVNNPDAPAPYSMCGFNYGIMFAVVIVLSFACIAIVCISTCIARPTWLPKQQTCGTIVTQPNANLSQGDNIVLLQCPSAAAVAPSKLSIISPFTGCVIQVDVPPGMHGGEYFFAPDTSSSLSLNDRSQPTEDFRCKASLQTSQRVGLCCHAPQVNYRDQGREGLRHPMGWYCCLLSDPLSAHRLINGSQHTAAQGAAIPNDSTPEPPFPGRQQLELRSAGRKATVATKAFDCIRGFGAVQVFCGHFFSYFSQRRGLPYAPDFGGGDAVLMFFVMSGFLMMVGYTKSKARLRDENMKLAACQWIEFLAHRVARLGPVYWLSVLLFAPFTIIIASLPSSFTGSYYNGSVGQTVASYVATITFTQTWFVELGYGNINGPLWSVCAQFFCYVFFPLLQHSYFTVRNFPRYASEVCSFWSLYLMLWVGTFLLIQDYLFVHINPVNKLPLFILGMICGSQALTNAAVTPSPEYIHRWGKICNGTTLLISSYFFAQVVTSFLFDGAGLTARVIGELFLPPVYGLWLYSFTQAPHSLSYRLFSWQPFKRIGDYSFAFYCLHWPVLTYYSWMRFGSGFFATLDPAVARDPSKISQVQNNRLHPVEIIPAFLLVLLVSAGAYHGVEQPCRIWLYKCIKSVNLTSHSAIPHTGDDRNNSDYVEMTGITVSGTSYQPLSQEMEDSSSDGTASANVASPLQHDEHTL